jgi:hypothetical protein
MILSYLAEYIAMWKQSRLAGRLSIVDAPAPGIIAVGPSSNRLDWYYTL